MTFLVPNKTWLAIAIGVTLAFMVFYRVPQYRKIVGAGT